ncbi:MAG: DUF2059 domain-containing protein [Rhodobacteraceae bacterium]|nr:DUF2059 domain-containing protein [Paracoccaceae bacterium]
MTHIASNSARLLSAACAALLSLAFLALPARAADRAQIETFLEVTGFDAALESIKFNARAAPSMLGVEPDEFGRDWTRLAESVFEVEEMHDMAVEILSATLDDDMLDHAVEFYGSDLGQRLVEVENASHLSEEDEAKDSEGESIVAALRANGEEDRLDLFARMSEAVDASSNGLRAWQEVQIRFLMTASAAGVIELRLDEDGLRAMFADRANELQDILDESALESNAYTYKDFSNADVETYVEALEHPTMQRVYELLNAIQYEITANRFEILAVRMADLHPVQDI